MRLVAGLIVALAQTAVLGWLVWDRVSLLGHGREITVEVVPVDPRDLFRGDYVVLGYSFTRTGDITLPPGIKRGDPVFVTLKHGEGTRWDLAAVAASHPGAVDPSQVVLKGHVESAWPVPNGSATGRVRYGIESYFVHEGTGRALEQSVRDGKIDAVLAVGSSGDVAIKALEVDGHRIHQEPAL